MDTTNFTGNQTAKSSRGCIIWTIVILIVAAGIVFIPYNIQVSRYNTALNDYAAGNCQAAVGVFESVSTAFYVIDFDKVASSARQRHLECVQYLEIVANEETGNISQALLGYLDFVQEKRSQTLSPYALSRARTIFLNFNPDVYTLPETCYASDEFLKNAFFIHPEDQHSIFLLNCSRVFIEESEYDYAYSAQESLFTKYPGSSAAKDALSDLTKNPAACVNWTELQTLTLTKGIVPGLLKQCGMNEYNDMHWGDAITYFEILLESYPTNTATREIKQPYAKALIEQARQGASITIDQPQRTGSTSSGTVVYKVTNSSPYEMRIVLSGPDSIVETISACTTCIKYTYAPDDCPSGVSKNITLSPGYYSVLVKSINSNIYVTPYTGSWSFSSGGIYSECFFIVTTP
jgi:hypothetical protein